ncbi:histidine phosphotransferase family protein [Amaricoccus tamworthensis]|uniref:histidine phosphotransferase family protein n=1 Tax=Amaricoccus tamworthensis TaxID=57002 RepID=UPI003C7E46C1
MNAQHLSALVSARLCHDLISPIGAIGNGLELLQLSGGAGSAEIDLISDSLGTAMSKIRFFRIAFGPADPEGRLMVDEMREVTSGIYNNRITVTWDIAERDIPRSCGQMLFLTLLCLEKGLPMGGQIVVTGGSESYAFSINARKVAPPAEFWNHVLDGVELDGLKSDGVQFALLRGELERSGSNLDVNFGETEATARLDCKVPQTV